MHSYWEFSLHSIPLRFSRNAALIQVYSGVRFLKQYFKLPFLLFSGEGGIGVSNALGANSLAILFALGVPWLIRTLTLVVQGAEDTAVYINSAGIDFVVGSLLVAVSCLWLVLCIAKFKLRKSVGGVLFILYLIFITFAILVEMGIILDRSESFV